MGSGTSGVTARRNPSPPTQKRAAASTRKTAPRKKAPVAKKKTPVAKKKTPAQKTPARTRNAAVPTARPTARLTRGQAQSRMRAVESTAAHHLDRRTAQGAMEFLEQQKAKDHDAYDKRTALRRDQDIFMKREEEAKLFDPSAYFPKIDSRFTAGTNTLDLFGNGRSNLFSTPMFDRRPNVSAADMRVAEDMRTDAGIYRHIKENHPDAKYGTEAYRGHYDEYRSQDKLRRHLMQNPGDLDARLKVDPRRMTPEQPKTYNEHRHAQRINEEQGRIQPRVDELDQQYEKNGWSDDSPYRGIDDAAFLQDIEKKDPKTVSRGDAYGALEAIDRAKHSPALARSQYDFESVQAAARQRLGDRNAVTNPRPMEDFFGQNKKANPFETRIPLPGLDPAIVNPQPGTNPLYFRDAEDMRASGMSATDIKSREAAMRFDPDNPKSFLRVAEDKIGSLGDSAVDRYNKDVAKYKLDNLQRDMQGQLIGDVTSQVKGLDKHFERLLAEQGVVGKSADWMKNKPRSRRRVDRRLKSGE